MMKALETTATITEVGQLMLDTPLEITPSRRVRVIILMNDDEELEDDDTPTEIVVAGIRQGLHEALTGKTIPLAQMWEGIDAE